MKFSLTIDCDNDAFRAECHSYDDEVADILMGLAVRLQHGVAKSRDAGNLSDSNGNFVGSWQFEEIEETEDE